LGSVLAIDADPNSNLGEVLGVKAGENIGKILMKYPLILIKFPQE